MGRIKKYKTLEDRLNAARIASHKYYLKNADKIRKRRMEKYYELRKNLQSNN